MHTHDHPNPDMRPRLSLSIFLIIATAAVSFSAEKKPAPGTVQRMPTVTALTGSLLTEERAVGPTGRPEWTSARRFSTTRVYIQKDPWEAGVAAWWRLRHNRDGTWATRATAEVEIGLPHRLQLDLYEDVKVDGSRHSRHEDFAAEIRWALADWGKIPLNPTLYAEYKWVADGADVFEAKLLLGDQLPGGWHYGINLVWEKELGGPDRTNEFQVVGGLSKTLLDGRLSLGAEAKYVNESVTGKRSSPAQKFLIGPSAQWRITDRVHLDVTTLFGTNRDAQLQEFWFILGYDFGSGGEHHYAPRTGLRN